MSTVLFKRGTETEMNNTPIVDGSLYFCTSNHKIYMDNGNDRLQYGGDTSIISDPSQASSSNVFSASATVNLFLQKTTVVDTKSAALAVTQNYIPLGCKAFKEAIGTVDYSGVGNGTLSSAVVTNKNSITAVNNQLKANNNDIYMDYHDGKYGVNTSSSRGADTFIPFKELHIVEIGTFSGYGTFNLSSYDDYQSFTVNNFMFGDLSISASGGGNWNYSTSASNSMAISYDSSTGVLNVASGSCSNTRIEEGTGNVLANCAGTIHGKVYLVYA